MKTPNTHLADELKLTKVKAFAIDSSDGEFSSSVKGYYKNYTIATVKAKGSGWYGSNGTVHEVFLHTDGEQLYEVRALGNYADVNEQVKKDMIENIKKKLSPEELEFIVKNSLEHT